MIKLFLRFLSTDCIELRVICGLLLLGLSVPGIPSALASLGVGHTGMAAAAAAASRLGLSGLAVAGGHNVLLVSNLNPEVSTHAIKQLYYLCFCFSSVLSFIQQLHCLLFTLWLVDPLDQMKRMFLRLMSYHFTWLHEELPLPLFLIARGSLSQNLFPFRTSLCLTKPAAFLPCHFAHCEF